MRNLTLVVGLLVLALLLALEHLDEIRLRYELNLKRVPPEHRVPLTMVSQARDTADPAAALRLADRAAMLADSLPGLSGRLRAEVYAIEGDVHWNLWQYVEARAAWQKAARLATGRRQEELNARLDGVGVIVEKDDGERSQDSVYLATPNTGPAARLSGRVVVAYVFLEDAGPGHWSPRDRDLALRSWRRAAQWLEGSARRYGAAVSFSERLFLVDRNPQIRRRRVASHTKGYEVGSQVARLAVWELGRTDVVSFLRRLQREERADQAMLLFHLPRDGRSFATQCWQTCRPAGEHAFLMESARPKQWEQIEHAQAHEALHLFGADDLYNIRTARDYALRDVMHHPSRLLAASSVEPLTAFAVGLRGEPVPAPFPVRIIR